MNKNSRRALLALLMLASGQTVAAPTALSATIVPLTNGGQAVAPPILSDASFGLSEKRSPNDGRPPAVVDRGPVRPELWGIGRRDAGISPLENYEQWQQAKAASSAPTQKFYVPEGFEVSLLRTAAGDEGSWIALGFDAQGRALVSREDQGFLRFSFDDARRKVERVEQVASDLKECRGLLYAYDRWYANANNSKGMYRFQIDEAGKIVDQKLLREFPGGGGHGRNDLALGKDGRIYSIHGDSVETPTVDVLDRTSPLDRQKPGAKPNRGYVISTDADGELDATLAKLNGIFGLIEEMQAVDTDGVEPMSHPQELAQRLRADVVGETDRRAAYQAIAPQTEAGLYLVPKVIE